MLSSILLLTFLNHQILASYISQAQSEKTHTGSERGRTDGCCGRWQEMSCGDPLREQLKEDDDDSDTHC